ncbi:hypothetical protein GQX74_003952 [Glossina fuscipes]|nr:hypothetical protein GQX74_003952 [Glossina fuscipes]
MIIISHKYIAVLLKFIATNALIPFLLPVYRIVGKISTDIMEFPDLTFSSINAIWPSTYQHEHQQHHLKNCTNSETIYIESGCEITNKRCQCWPTLTVCQNDVNAGIGTIDIRWHFKTIEDCQLNLQNLIKLEMEFDEDYTVSPTTTFTYKKLRRKRRSSKKRSDDNNEENNEII